MKPRLRLSTFRPDRRGNWVCIGTSWPLYAIGRGHTPVEAYDDYVAKLQEMAG